MKVYATISSYILGRVFGPQIAASTLQEMVTSPNPSQMPLPGCITVKRLAMIAPDVDSVTLHADGGGTHIAKTRSRHFTAALEADADVWLTVDDDVEADKQCLSSMLLLLDSKEPRVVIAPCYMRGTEVVNIQEPPIRQERSFPVRHRVIHAGGFGLVGVNRAALQTIGWRWERVDDVGGKTLIPVFAEKMTSKAWLGEDVSFCERARDAAVELLAVLVGTTKHDDGPTLNLGGLDDARR